MGSQRGYIGIYREASSYTGLYRVISDHPRISAVCLSNMRENGPRVIFGAESDFEEYFTRISVQTKEFTRKIYHPLLWFGEGEPIAFSIAWCLRKIFQCKNSPWLDSDSRKMVIPTLEGTSDIHRYPRGTLLWIPTEVKGFCILSCPLHFPEIVELFPEGPKAIHTDAFFIE